MSVILSFHRLANWLYDDGCFGSWWVESVGNKIMYDGRDGFVNHLKNGETVKIMHWKVSPKLSDIHYCIDVLGRE